MMLPEETAYFKPAGTQGENRARKIQTNHISYESSLIAQHDPVMPFLSNSRIKIKLMSKDREFMLLLTVEICNLEKNQLKF